LDQRQAPACVSESLTAQLACKPSDSRDLSGLRCAAVQATLIRCDSGLLQVRASEVGLRKPHRARIAPSAQRTTPWRAKAHRHFGLLVPHDGIWSPIFPRSRIGLPKWREQRNISGRPEKVVLPDTCRNTSKTEKPRRFRGFVRRLARLWGTERQKHHPQFQPVPKYENGSRAIEPQCDAQPAGERLRGNNRAFPPAIRKYTGMMKIRSRHRGKSPYMLARYVW
jgi:hypothetical protein